MKNNLPKNEWALVVISMYYQTHGHPILRHAKVESPEPEHW